MEGDMNITPSQTVEDQCRAGLKKTQDILATSIVTVKRDGVEVTITAEPKVLNVTLPEEGKPKALESILRDCLNEAFSESMNAVYENTAKTLTTKSP